MKNRFQLEKLTKKQLVNELINQQARGNLLKEVFNDNTKAFIQLRLDIMVFNNLVQIASAGDESDADTEVRRQIAGLMSKQMEMIHDFLELQVEDNR